MKRINEKVKDLIEVRNFKSLQDFFKDPTETLSAYQFTETTADMMAKWLDRVSDVQPDTGHSLALAGYRGVGKSHFLAAFGAILTQPELRSRIADNHVSVSTQRLKRRRYPVTFVKRGTCDSLLDELRESIARTFEIPVASLSSELSEVLADSAERAGELPFVLIIDTALERSARVARNDGETLGAIAQHASKLNMFVGVALDDDIAGADGANLAISRSFAIDYLDQEHLYRIVDTHVFPKSRHTQPLIHDIYEYFREVLPHFRWSEQRFSALYPLHPMILEVAPYIRFYAPAFALLGFASEAGARVLGRPANSLIALDEAFDCAEKELRKVDDLQNAFAAYDKLNADVVGQIPVMQRLQAKLILKGLLLLSLDGNGTTAGEISAAMLIFDEASPAASAKAVEDLLEKFVAVLPDQIQRKADSGRDIRYSLKVSATDDLNNALNEAVAAISEAVVPSILRKVARERYSDWTFPEDSDPKHTNWTDSQISWRGGLRRGRICWSVDGTSAEPLALNAEFIDWIVFITSEDSGVPVITSDDPIPQVYWQHARLRPDEIETIKRYHVLLNDATLRSSFGDQIRTVGHSHSHSVEKIWRRIFLEDGKLVIQGLDYNFSEDARNTQQLADVFSEMLEPLFELEFPDHPRFTQTLGMTDVSTLVLDFFSGARQNLGRIQHLAEAFAYPLGLVAQRGNEYVPESEDALLELPAAREILGLVSAAGDATVSLKSIYRRLKRAPVGMVREAQHLVLAALVANRKIEFVTTKGDRINRRSLDLKIIWDDIEGIAKPTSVAYSNERLTNWARLITTNDRIRSIEDAIDRAATVETLKIWLNDWNAAKLLERFNELPDEILNTRIWRLSVLAEKTFGTVARVVSSVVDGSITLDDGLQRIADAFTDSEEDFFARTQDLVVLEDFISGTKRREEIWSYVAVCEVTEDDKIEFFREKLLAVIKETIANPNQLVNREMENFWQSFHNRYSEHFAIKHDMIMKSHHLQERFDEIMRSDEWWEFENLSKLPVFPGHYWRQTQELCRQFRELDCRFSVREMLKTHPFCACSFNLAQIPEWERLPQKMTATIDAALASYRNILLQLGENVLQLLGHFVKRDVDDEYTTAASSLMRIFAEGRSIPPLTNAELIILQKIFENIPTTLLFKSSFPETSDYVSRNELVEITRNWLNDVPDLPALVKI